MIKPYPLSRARTEVELVPQALISGSLAELARRHRWTLEEGEDDFDSFIGAGFVLGQPLHPDFAARTPFAVMRYKGHPHATATIYLPFQVQDLKVITKAVARILQELDVSQKLLWQRRDQGAPAA